MSKKIRLTDRGRKNLEKVLDILLGVISLSLDLTLLALVIIVLTAMLSLLVGVEDDISIYLGGLGWCALISFIIVYSVSWIYKNIEIYEEPDVIHLGGE